MKGTVGAGVNLNINLNLPDVTWTGDVREDNTAYCVFNDWKCRDRMAKINGAYNRRFSRGTPLGKWYCYAK